MPYYALLPTSMCLRTQLANRILAILEPQGSPCRHMVSQSEAQLWFSSDDFHLQAASTPHHTDSRIGYDRVGCIDRYPRELVRQGHRSARIVRDHEQEVQSVHSVMIPGGSADAQTLQVFEDILFRSCVLSLPVDACARKGGVVVLWERDLVKGVIHLPDAGEIGALVGSKVPRIGVSLIKTNEGFRERAVLLPPDVPAGADAHRRQTLLQRGSPDIAVQVNAKDEGALVDELVCTGRVYGLPAQAAQKVLVWLSEARLLVERLDLLPTF